jgi:hypothetical protein
VEGWKCHQGPPLARSLARGLLANQSAIASANISTAPVASVADGAENLFTLVEEISRLLASGDGLSADGGPTICSGGAAAGAQGRCPPGWVFSALTRFSRQADGARTSDIFRELEAITSPQGMLQFMNALCRLICSSGKPTLAGESVSKTDLPKIALEFRIQAHEELGKCILSKLPQHPLRAIGHGAGAPTSTALRMVSSLCEDSLTCQSFIPMMSKRPIGGEVMHGELSAQALEDSVRKLAPAIDYLVHGLIGMPRANAERPVLRQLSGSDRQPLLPELRPAYRRPFRYN